MRLTGTRTQDLIFTLYGDYLDSRGGIVWVGALIALLEALGASEQAVRSAASRMARKGWLDSGRQGRHSFYALTPAAVALLSEGRQQIHLAPQDDEWDGYWYLVNYSFTKDMERVRHQFCKRLAWSGFGRLGNSAWISPHDRRDVLRNILDTLDVHQYVDVFKSAHISFREDEELAARCWDLDELNRDYQQFIDKYQPELEQARQDQELEPEYAFQQRFWLMHEYRYFPFHDPYLPCQFLPEDWAGFEAASIFRDYHRALRDGANAYVDQVIAQTPSAN